MNGNETRTRAKILIVDDTPSNIHTLNDLLRDRYDVIFATSGAKGLELCRDQKPDLVLLDMTMPEIDGIEVCRRLKADPVARRIPVIFVTARTDLADEERALEAGAIDFFMKPVVAPILRKRVANHLELKRQQDDAQVLIGKLQAVQAQLLQSEKMAAIGQLAAGVAHEINNPVGYVASNLNSLGGYVETLRKMFEVYAACEPMLPPAQRTQIEEHKKAADLVYLLDDVGNLVQEALEGTRRIRQIVQDLKEFSHVDAAEWQWADLHKCIDSTLNVVHNELKYKAEVVKEYSDIPNVFCLPTQLGQVFMNLLVNAAYAIPEKGRITIRTGGRGDTAFVEISDTGAGISADNLPRLFEPFFTTKPVGKGTGLGLSVAYGIVKKHGGHFDVESTVGKGTTFRVWLPVAGPTQQGAGAPDDGANGAAAA
jgi:two-component system NtrC family sensor kinase